MRYITPEYIEECKKIQHLIEPKDMNKMNVYRAGLVCVSTNSKRLNEDDIFLPDLGWLVGKGLEVGGCFELEYCDGIKDDTIKAGYYCGLTDEEAYLGDTPELACLKALVQLMEK